MDVFALRNALVSDYADYINSFINIQDERIRCRVEHELQRGLLWPEPLLQLNPSFEPGPYIDDLVDQGVLHETCRSIFRLKARASRTKPLLLPQTPGRRGPGGEIGA